MDVPAGSIVGIIGANRAGKSTFFKMSTEQETPDSGEIELGETVHLAYVDQSRDALDDNKTVCILLSYLEVVVMLSYQMSQQTILIQIL